jgi:colanic acid biosynthesis glycosyl transferase WcaI
MEILVHDYAGHSFAVDLSRGLAGRRHRVTHAFASELLTPRGLLERGEGDPEGLRFRPVPMSPNYRRDKYAFGKRLWYERRYGAELQKLVEAVRPEIILSGQTPSDPQWALAKAARRLRIPLVTWVQDFYGLAVEKLLRKRFPLLGAVAGPWYRHLDRCIFRESSEIVAITDDFLEPLGRFGVERERISVIPNWASLDGIPMLEKDNAWSVAEGWEGKFVFLYAGTLAMKHDPELLLELARAFRAEASVRVVVISEGPGEAFLRQHKDREGLSHLLIYPFQPFELFPQILAAADVALAILEPESGVFSVPSKVLSYLAAGKPILASLPGQNLAARILSESGAGLCVEPGRRQDWVAAARRLREQGDLRGRMGSLGRSYAEKTFNLERITNQFEALFERARNRFAGTARGGRF